MHLTSGKEYSANFPLTQSKKFAPNWSRWHHADGENVGPPGSPRAGRKKEVTPYATHSCSASCLGVVPGRRGIRWLGATRLPYGTRPARAVPRAVLPGWARPRRGAVDTLARLLPSPRPDRLLGRSQVARGQS